MEELIEMLKELLELDELDSNAVLADLADWDSLAALSVIAQVGLTYGVNLTAGQLREGSTPASLFSVIQQAKVN